MIAPEVIQQVRCLLAEGKLSQRAVARRTRVSRGTVGAIAAGKRPDYRRRPPVRNEAATPRPAGPTRRCPGCGGMVQMPCRTCGTRKAMADLPGPPAWLRLGQLDEPLGLDLRGEHRARYEEIRRRRIQRADSAVEADDPWEAPEPDDETFELDPADLRDAFEFDDGPTEIDDLANLEYEETFPAESIYTVVQNQ